MGSGILRPDKVFLDSFIHLGQKDLQEINSLLMRLTTSNIPLIEQIGHYILNSGGKRLRSLLAVFSAKMFGYEETGHYKLAVGIECIHTATLLHDDVLDESEERRGKKTAHTLWGNKVSILVGDFLFSRAFQIVVEIQSIEVLEVLSNVVAVITEGEIQQNLLMTDPEVTQEQYFYIIRAKTAELFATACVSGAILAGQSLEMRENLFQYGISVGEMFQIVDDMLDYSGNVEQMGKNNGDDFYEGKITYPLILLMERLPLEDKKIVQALLKKDQRSCEDLEIIVHYLQSYDIFPLIHCKVVEIGEKARSFLKNFPSNEYQQALDNLISFCIVRLS